MPPFWVSLGVFTFLLLIAKIMELTDMVVTKGVSPGDVALLLLYNLPYFLVFTIPMATLLGVLMGFLRMSGDNEITALKSSGVGLVQLLPPVILLALMAWAASSALALWGQPWGQRSFQNQLFKVARSQADLALKERVFLDTFPGLVIYVNRLPGEGMLEDVFLVDERDESKVHTIVAKRGRIFPARQGKVVLRLQEGSLHSVDPALTSAQTANFATYDVTIETGDTSQLQRTEKHVWEMYVGEIMEEMDNNQPGSARYIWMETELHNRFSLPVACLVMSLVGLSLGARSRRGRSWGVAAGLVLFFAYYLMLSSAWSFGETGMYPVAIGIWTPNAVFGLLGLIMFYRELKEAPLPFSGLLGTLSARLRGLLARLKRSQA